WWFDLHTGEPLVRNEKELRMLIISEFAEAMEGERKDLMDDKLPHRKMAEVEIADAVIRMLDMAAGLKIEIGVPQWNLEDIIPPENKGECLFDLVGSIID